MLHFFGAAVAGLFSSASFVVISVKTQFLDSSQLINDICKLFRKLFKCFNGTTISASLVLLFSSSLSGVFPIVLLLYSDDAEFVIGSVEISL